MSIWQKNGRSELINAQKNKIVLHNKREIRQFIKNFQK